MLGIVAVVLLVFVSLGPPCRASLFRVWASGLPDLILVPNLELFELVWYYNQRSGGPEGEVFGARVCQPMDQI